MNDELLPALEESCHIWKERSLFSKESAKAYGAVNTMLKKIEALKSKASPNGRQNSSTSSSDQIVSRDSNGEFDYLDQEASS